MANYLPIEVVLEILSRLPAKPLMRFICASKSLYNIIHDPSFIKLHLRYSNNNGYLIQHRNKPVIKNMFIHCDEKFMESEKLDIPIVSGQLIQAVSLCNGIVGLVCLRILQHSYRTNPNDLDIHLWNPSIRKLKTLPQFHYTDGLRDYGISGVFALGYCQRSDDYKVLRIMHSNHKTGSQYLPVVRVYMVGTNSWKSIEPIVPHISPYPWDRETPIYLNGATHWMEPLQWKDDGRIVSFDFVDEVFKETMIPKCITFTDEVGMEKLLGICKEWLCLFVCSLDLYGLSYLWIMKKYGESESWVKYLSYDLVASLVWCSPVNLGKNGEILLVSDGNHRELVAYDRAIQTLKRPGVFSVIRVMNWADSLVLLNDGNAVAIQNNS